MSEYVHFVFALGQLRASSFHELTVLRPRRIPSGGGAVIRVKCGHNTTLKIQG